MELTTGQIAGILNGTVEGDASVRITGFARIESGKPGQISFYANPKYEKYVYRSNAGAIIVNRDFEAREKVAATLIRVDNAYEAVAALLDYVTAQKRVSRRHRGRFTHICLSARLGRKVYVGDCVSIGRKTVIGSRTKIYDHVSIGDNVTIGENCTIYPNVTIYPGMVIGNNVILHAGVVIGADGFGFAPTPDGPYKKIEHSGNVIIEDDVEIGANSCVDKSQMGSTIIHRGVKIDNLCQVAHNVEIGEDTVCCAQVGIAGSAKIGNRCVLAGQVGVVGHISVADRTTVSAKSGVTNNVKKEGSVLSGIPAFDHREWLRSSVLFRRSGRAGKE